MTGGRGKGILREWRILKTQGDFSICPYWAYGMMDIVNKKTRSRMMSSVRAKNTKVELEIRRRLFAMGFRYRLHRKDLPGTPDMVFQKYRSVVFIHGCFWHYHSCHLSSIPETRRSWWKTKLEETARRDSMAISKLRNLDWRVLTIWECGFRRPGANRTEALDTISKQAADFLNSNKRLLQIPRARRRRRTKEAEDCNLHGKKNV